MSERMDRILVVTPDEEERYVIVEATLLPSGYDVIATGDGNEALQMAFDERPDAMILDLHPENLSGRDILIALSSQALDIPSIVVADRGRETDALQAFRVGAKDYLLRPIREAEMIQAVERLLRDVRYQREREALVEEVRVSGLLAEQRLKELKTLMGIGKTVASQGRLDQIFDRVVRAAIYLTQAETVGFYLRDRDGNLILRAGQNLPRELLDQYGRAVKDDLAQLVLNSQETYRGAGEGLQKFHPAMLEAWAVIYAPLILNERAIGLLWVANTRTPFEPHMTDIMSALADYGSIAIFNNRILTAMQARSRQLEEALEAAGQAPVDGQAAGSSLGAKQIASQVRDPLTVVMGNLGKFRTGEMGEIPAGNRAAVDVLYRQVSEVVELIDSVVPPNTGGL